MLIDSPLAVARALALASPLARERPSASSSFIVVAARATRAGGRDVARDALDGDARGRPSSVTRARASRMPVAAPASAVTDRRAQRESG